MYLKVSTVTSVYDLIHYSLLQYPSSLLAAKPSLATVLIGRTVQRAVIPTEHSGAIQLHGNTFLQN